MANRKLELRLHKLVCVDETNAPGPIHMEPGSDEMALSGITVDASGRTGKIPEFRVGAFDDNEKKVFSPPRRLATFDLPAAKGFPETFAATLVLAEKDHGGLSKLVDGLEGRVKGEIKERLGTLVGAAVGSVGGPAGMAIGAIAGTAVDEAFGKLAKLVGDDVFPPRTAEVTLQSPEHRFKGGALDSPEFLLEYKAHGGTYRLVCDWRLIA